VLGGLALAGYGLLRLVYATSPSMPHSRFGFLRSLDNSFSAENLAKFARTLAGSFAWESRFLPAALNLLLGLALVFALLRLVLARGRFGEGRVLGWLSLAMAVQLGLILLRGVAVGRYLMPLLPVLAALVVGGLVFAARERGVAARRFAAVLVAYDAYYLFGGLVVHEYLLLGA
jgi:hypothetical protein